MSVSQGRVAIINMSRRSFAGVTPAAGLVLAVGWVDDPLAFVAIAADGTVTITCHRQAIGQGVRTPMVIADELEADWRRVRVKQSTDDEARFGNLDADGSRAALRHFFEPMRQCGAAAKAMLEQAAAARWQVPFGEVDAINHEVVHRPTNRWLGYGDLAAAASRLPVPPRDTLRLKTPAQFIDRRSTSPAAPLHS
jgi:isoquinoline 1-oxidoreductase subunit beta